MSVLRWSLTKNQEQLLKYENWVNQSNYSQRCEISCFEVQFESLKEIASRNIGINTKFTT